MEYNFVFFQHNTKYKIEYNIKHEITWSGMTLVYCIGLQVHLQWVECCITFMTKKADWLTCYRYPFLSKPSKSIISSMEVVN